MKLPQVEHNIPIPERDGRGMYQRPATELASFLIALNSGDSFVCGPSLFRRVRGTAQRMGLSLIMRKIGPMKHRVWIP